MSNLGTLSKEGLKIKTDRQIDLLNRKIQELTSENQILREINVKLQIENFKLQKKLESKQLEEELEDECNDKIEAEVEENADKSEFYTVVYSEDQGVETEEYLEEEAIYEVQEEDLVKESPEVTINDPKSLKRSYSKVFEDNESDIDSNCANKKSKTPKEDVKYEFTVLENDNEGSFIADMDEAIESENCQISPKEAILQIYKLASKSAALQKIKSIEKGKQKDSAFVSRVLDLLFDKITLATSTAHGQKCQSKLHLPAKPALDQSKVDLCMKAFNYRLDQENIKEEELQMRLKSFNKLVNDKIQNCRKCLLRTDSSKLLET